jgi:hypothetical protein
MARGSVIARILSEYSDKGTKAAVKDLDKVGKDFKKFGDKVGKAFAVATAASAAFAVKIGVDAVKAAIADQQSAAILANTLHNVVGANDAVVASVEDFILQTSLATGVVDDQLRPALGLLIASSKDVGKAQALMGLALDVSAGASVDLEAVSKALAKAQNGNFGALQRLLPSLDKNIVKTKDFQGALKLLADTYGGAALAKAQTFQGQIDRIKVAFNETKESIGYGLLPAITALADTFTNKVFPAILDFLNKNGDKVVGVFQAAVGYVVAFAKSVYDVFSFVARNIRVFAELGAVIVAALAGAKVAAAAEAIIGVVMTLIKVYKGLRSAALGAAAAEALLTGGISAAAGAAAFAVALVGINVAMNKFEKDANKASDSVGNLKFNFNGLKVGAGDYTKGLKGIDSANNATTKSTQNLTKAQIDALAALKKLGVIPTTETNPIELEAARLNLVKQGRIEEAMRTQALMDQLEAQMKTNLAAQRYADILQALADNKISTEEVSVLASKWGVTAGQVVEYIAKIYAANATPASTDSIIALYMSWGMTKAEATKYLDFVNALKDNKLDDSEIQKLMTGWNLTRAEVIAYAKRVQDGTVFSSSWADPGKLAQDSWEKALAALNEYLAKIPGLTTTNPAASKIQTTEQILASGNFTDSAIADLARLQSTYSKMQTVSQAAKTTEEIVASGSYSNSAIADLARLQSTYSTMQNLGSNSTPQNTAGTTIIVQGNVVTQADNLAAIRNDLLNAQLSGKQIQTLAVTL